MNIVRAPQDSLVTAEVAQGSPPPGRYTHIRVRGGEMPVMQSIYVAEAPQEERVVEKFALTILENSLRIMYETLQDLFGQVHVTLLDRKWWEERRFQYDTPRREEWIVASRHGVGIHIEKAENHALQFYLVADFIVQGYPDNEGIEAIHVQQNGDYSIVDDIE